MNPGEKQNIKAQLMAIGQIINAHASIVMNGAAQPVATAMGPAAAPGVIQMATALNMQTTQILKLVDLVGKIVDDL